MFSEELPVVEETIIPPAAVNISPPTGEHGPNQGTERHHHPFTDPCLW